MQPTRDIDTVAERMTARIFDPSPLTYEQKVDVFYEQTLGWRLHIADLIANGGTTFGQCKPPQPGYAVRSIWHSGFAVLHICLSYFELVGSLVSFEA
jgi:hypothetical protein